METHFLRYSSFATCNIFRLSILVCLLLFSQLVDGELLNFHVIVKNTNNSFFNEVKEGCDDEAARISDTLVDGEVKCIYDGPGIFKPEEQADIMDRVIRTSNASTAGIAISVSDSDIITPLISKARKKGIPVVTFDSDAINSERLAYIGTNQYIFGQELGKMLIQLAPLGGIYGLLADNAPNIKERVRGVRDGLSNHSKWKEIKGGKSPAVCEDDTAIALEKMAELAEEPNIGAIISVGGWPMYNETGWSEFVKMNRNLKLVVGDSLDVQMDIMNKGLVDGLVGQLPYEMGRIAIDALWNATQNITVKEEIYGTNLLEILLFPLVLPPLNANRNNKGNLWIMGATFYTIIVLLSFGLLVWTWIHRKHRVVRSSQPFFLIMICIGVLIMGSSIIPMGFDDKNCDIEKPECQKRLNIACMCIPWLFYPGITTVFSALFSKLWRINIILAKSRNFTKVKIMPKDVIVPYVFLMLSNVIVLTCWTLIDPLIYRRQYGIGTDEWNRVNSSFGTCSSAKNSTPYTFTLTFILIFTLVLANVQAFRARKVHTELSESRYIAYIMVAFLQLVLVGMPMFYLTNDNPPSHYALNVIIVFLMSLLPLLLIFSPKIQYIIQQNIRKKRDEDVPAVQGCCFGKEQAHHVAVVHHGEPNDQEEGRHSDLEEEEEDDDDYTGMLAGVVDIIAIAEQSIRSTGSRQSRRRINIERKQHSDD